MTSAKYITTETLADALGIPLDVSDTDIIDRIHELRQAADEEPKDSSGEETLIRRGEHERVVKNQDGTLTVTMLKPFKFGGETITSLTLREPEAADLRMLDGKKGTGASLVLIGRLAGRVDKELSAMKMVDIKTVSAAVAFLSAGGQ